MGVGLHLCFEKQGGVQPPTPYDYCDRFEDLLLTNDNMQTVGRRKTCNLTQNPAKYQKLCECNSLSSIRTVETFPGGQRMPHFDGIWKRKTLENEQAEKKLLR